MSKTRPYAQCELISNCMIDVFKAYGVDAECAKFTFKETKDIRDKYVLSRLAWDLGILDELCELL